MNEPSLPKPSGPPVDVPRQYRGHPLLNAGPYFTIPKTLLEAVVAEIGEERFDDGLLEMEYALSQICQDHRFQIGFWGGQSIRFQLLRPNYELSGGSLAKGLSRFGKSEEEARAILTLAGQRLDWTADVRRGYCGWLMTNDVFLREHRAIFGSWKEETSQNGIPVMGPVVSDAQEFSGVQDDKGDKAEFVRQFEDFFARWRLEGMPAPFVPQPMGPHLPVADLRRVLGHMHSGGTTFFFPDICSVPSRDNLREILEQTLRDVSAPDYLKEWFDIVHSGNVAKNQILRYARIFELQHYMRVLHARHANGLRRKKTALKTVFAEFLDVSDDSIERDLSRIESRLGPDWHLSSA